MRMYSPRPSGQGEYILTEGILTVLLYSIYLSSPKRPKYLKKCVKCQNNWDYLPMNDPPPDRSCSFKGTGVRHRDNFF